MLFKLSRQARWLFSTLTIQPKQIVLQYSKKPPQLPTTQI